MIFSILLRSEYSQKFTDNEEKLLFLAAIRPFSTIQSSLYLERRQHIPPAPDTQADFDVTKEWFFHNGKSIIIGDKVISFLSKAKLSYD